MAQNPFEKALADEGLVGTPLEPLARSIYMQESSSGQNTKTSNAGAVGGMQILPGTFKEVLPGGDINNPYDNSRAGLRYIKQMYNQSGGDLNLTAVGYYGGPGGMQKAKQGVAVSDPRNPNAPTTLEYAKQVLARTNKPNQPNKPNKNVSRETLKPEKVIADLGQNYQAAYALMSMADEEP
jgi:SLT domain-containing protein